MAVLAVWVFTAVALVKYGDLEREFGWSAVAGAQGFVIDRVTPSGPAAGRLQPGDRILALNGDRRASQVGLTWPAARAITPGATYTLRVEHAGAARDVALSPVETREPERRWRLGTYLLLSLPWLVIGVLLGLLNPTDPVVRLGSAAFIVAGLVLLNYALGPAAMFLDDRALPIWLAIAAVSPWHVALGYHFYYRFPPGVPPARFWSRVAAVLYGAAVLYFLADSLPWTIAYFLGTEATATLLLAYGRVFDLTDLLFAGILAAGFMAIAAVIARNRRLVTAPDQRRRLRWAVYGSVAGLALLVLNSIWSAAQTILGREPSLDRPFDWLSLTANLCTVVIPLGIGYASIKHRVLDITVVIRQGVRYLLATNALRMLLSLPLVALAYTVISNRHLTVAEILSRNSSYLFWIAAAGLSLKFRGTLGRWVDRRFFREAYDREQILFGLMEDIDELDRMGEIAELVSARLEFAMHPRSQHVWYREKDAPELRLTYSSDALALDAGLSTGSALARWLEQEGGALDAPPDEAAGISSAERLWLERMGIALIVPILDGSRRLIGVLMLGEKKSEEPYTPRDRKLLQAVAKQISVVGENLTLKERVGEDHLIKREMLARLEDRRINLVKECPSCGACFDGAAEACPADGSELTLSLPVERVIDGKYRLDRLIGKGGMGAVYEATDLRLQRTVAVKIMLGPAFGRRAALERFEREARASARLSHANLITVFDYGGLDGGGAYLVMERAHGATLRSEINRRGRIPPDQAADWFDQILEGVKAAHAHGIVHRDLKPENLLIVRTGAGRPQVKILDFGLAKIRPLAAIDGRNLTGQGAVLGTLGYMSPEQLAGGDIDERGDIFAIGVLAVEALTGRRPFDGASYADVFRSVLHDPFHLDRSSVEASRLDEVLQRCLAKNRADRYRSIDELQQNLVPAIRAYRAAEEAASPAPDAETRIL